VAYIICGIYLVMNLKHDIHMLQQNSYRLPRYWRYLKDDITNMSRLLDVALLFLVFSTLVTPPVALLIVSCVALSKTWLILKKKFKKPLVFTNRVWRIYSVAGVLSVGCYLAVMLSAGVKNDIFGQYSGVTLTLGALLVLAIFSWAVVMLAVVILMPVEKMINQRYWNEASSILKSMPDLKVIGITGSYGKTSTKHYLERILAEDFDVLMTPGSYNTPMGVIRTVREMMKPYHKIFICEMGAKQGGDIKEICELVHPEMGIVTAVGPMHLETFKNMENVQKTKFELVDALPSDGLAVVNNDFDYCASREVNNVNVERYCVGEKMADKSDYVAEDLAYTPEGTSFTIKGPEGFEMKLKTRLVGGCNISNLLAAVIVALQLGMSEEKIKRGVAAIEQVEHRLSIKHTPGGVTIIDDAFNSNPSGSKMALEVLSGFKSGKRIVVTPGMIELGDKQYELNMEFGEEIAKNCDIAIIVGLYNRDAIVRGILRGDFPEENLYQVDSFNEAQKVLSTLLAPGDVVLYENDLPDSFK
ncbi:MAG: UDP-N-acetylmuramoyl-tripeptide--D-alanyl-D-alanine ligase, partial [Muribaculaceae bacterium]|nr:UDP-N-acetylmuramoyl-tripeptide--D-alanyl-D-alanine ligase [Muribaculaceae bacterium]